MKILLRAKAWQLFVLFFGIPYIAQIISMILSMAIENHMLVFSVSVFISIVSMGTSLMSWLWTLGTKLNAKVSPELSMKSAFFRFALIYSSIYILVFPFVVMRSIQSHSGIFLVIMPLHLFAIVCLFYAFYFVSKSLAMVERQQNVEFHDFTKQFFLMCFFPLGVWFIQPKINEIFKSEN